LNSGHTDLAWSHLLDPKSGQYNIPFLPTYLPDVKAVVVNLFHRELGLIMAPKNPFNIKGFEDLGKKGLRLINRQKGSGTRVLLDHHLKKAKIPLPRSKDMIERFTPTLRSVSPSCQRRRNGDCHCRRRQTPWFAFRSYC
jgi:molybdate-binding protein